MFRYRDGVFDACGKQDGCPTEPVSDIASTRDGTMWFAGPFGVARRRHGVLRAIRTEAHDMHGPARVRTSDQDVVWVTASDGWFRVQDDTLVPVRNAESQPAVRCLDFDKQGPIGRDHRGLLRIHPQDMTLRPLPVPLAEQSPAHPRFVGVDPRGRVWWDHEGAMHVADVPSDGKPVKAEDIESIPIGSDVSVAAFFVDREGTAWVGTHRQGLFQIVDRHIDRFTESDSPTPGFTVATDGGNGIWAGVNCDELWHVTPRESDRRIHLTEQRAGCINTTTLDSDGRLWVGLQRAIVMFPSVDSLTAPLRIAGPQDLPNGEVSALFQRRSGELLAGVRGLGIASIQAPLHDPTLTTGGTAALRLISDGLADPRVRCFAEDSAAALWVGTDGGVGRLAGGEWSFWRTTDGTPNGSVRSIWIDERDVVWVGTYGGGLGRFDGDHWVRFNMEHGLHDNVVSAIVPDDDGFLWFNGNRGVSRVLRRDLDRFARGEANEISPRSFASGEGNGGVQPAGCRAADGALWFPTIHGPIRLDPSQVTSLASPLAAIENVRCGAELRVDSPTGVIRAPKGKRSFVVEFASLTFLQPERALLRHRLVGLDDKWSVPHRHDHAIWSAVPPGHYRLELQARDEAGGWSEPPVTVEIVVPPYVWETLWFRIVMGLALLAFAFAMHRWRLRQQATHHMQLQAEILERQQAQEAQQRMHERLRRGERLQTLGRLAGGVAHDFNNFLAALFGASQLQRLQMDEGDWTGAREQNDLMEECVQRATALTNQLLAFGRRPVSGARVVALQDAVRASEKMIRLLLGKRTSLVLTLPSETVRTRVDPGQLDQILLNLCLNANEAMPGGGELHIGVDRVDVLTDETELRPGRWAVLRVHDTGVGIPESIRQSLFDPFFTTRQDSGGTGLGLSVVQDAVQQAGGWIQVESEPDRGAKFNVYLPLHDEVAEESLASGNSAASSAATAEVRGAELGWILLCDDDPAIRASLEEALVRQGYRVMAAASLSECMEKARTLSKPPGLLLTDVAMPGGTGPELARALRGVFPYVPVLYMSGFTAGAALEDIPGPRPRFLPKPFSIAQLDAEIQALTQRESSTGRPS